MKKKIIIISTTTAVVLIGIAVALFIFLSRPAFYVPVNSVLVLEGHAPNPQDFVALVQDRAATLGLSSPETTVEIRNLENINWNESGDVQVSLRLRQDGSLRSVQAEATAYIRTMPAAFGISVETPMDEIVSNWLFWTDNLPPLHNVLADVQGDFPANITNATGIHDLEFSLGGVGVPVQITVTDTTPPTATAVNITLPMGEMPEPYAFVTDVFDHSLPVTIEFAETPDIFQYGDQPVEITLTDRYGNSTVVASTFTVLPNTVPPSIYGVQNIYLMVDSAAMFRRGVTAEDTFGRPIDFTVDSSQVDIATLGVYTITYRAEDAWGLYTEVTAEVTVTGVDPEDVRERAQRILDTILRDGMTQVEQARAIFNWVGWNIAYTASFEHRSVYDSANQALTHRRGNCFVFYSISEVMLTLVGIPNMRVDRADVQPGQSRHAWNLINPDGLGWHHFDATPARVNINRFMFTQTQAEEFTARTQRETGTRNYFHIDLDLYPEIVR